MGQKSNILRLEWTSSLLCDNLAGETNVRPLTAYIPNVGGNFPAKNSSTSSLFQLPRGAGRRCSSDVGVVGVRA